MWETFDSIKEEKISCQKCKLSGRYLVFLQTRRKLFQKLQLIRNIINWFMRSCVEVSVRGDKENESWLLNAGKRKHVIWCLQTSVTLSCLFLFNRRFLLSSLWGSTREFAFSFGCFHVSLSKELIRQRVIIFTYRHSTRAAHFLDGFNVVAQFITQQRAQLNALNMELNNQLSYRQASLV